MSHIAKCQPAAPLLCGHSIDWLIIQPDAQACGAHLADASMVYSALS